MKKLILFGFVVIGIAFYFLPAKAEAESGRLYGTLRTIDGDTFEGWIRWDRNEAWWDDILDASKKIKDRKQYRKSRRSGSFFVWSGSAARLSELKFGHIRKIVPISSREAIVTLKSGEEYEMSGSDIGSSVREIIVDDVKEGEVYFDWDDIDEVSFSREPGEPDNSAERLYGKLTTRRGDEFVGWIEWDIDEVMSTDILDGDEGRRKNRKIPFGKIASIERRSGSSCIVELKSGDRMTLSGTNDVNSSNRGIRVKDPTLGRIQVKWDDFDKVRFMPAPADKLPRYDSFDGGRRIEGTVYTEGGKKFAGKIIWDKDEEYTWEHLNGKYHDIDVVIEFANIRMISKQSSSGAVVTTMKGRNMLLRDSNDVNSENSGIIVQLDNGDDVEIDWFDFDKLELK